MYSKSADTKIQRVYHEHPFVIHFILQWKQQQDHDDAAFMEQQRRNLSAWDVANAAQLVPICTQLQRGPGHAEHYGGKGGSIGTSSSYSGSHAEMGPTLFGSAAEHAAGPEPCGASAKGAATGTGYMLPAGSPVPSVTAVCNALEWATPATGQMRLSRKVLKMRPSVDATDYKCCSSCLC